MTTKTISYKNNNLFYRIIGKGNPVVLLHGFGEDGDIWQLQVDLLKDHFQLIIPDIPGSGASPLIPNPGTGIDEYAEAVKYILDEEAIQSSIMIGHSMGGYITLAFAEKYPAMLQSFGLFHSSAFADTEEKKGARAKSIEFIQNNGAYEFLKTAIPGLFTTEFQEQQAEKVNGLVEQGKKFSTAALVQYYQAMIARPDRTAVLKNFIHPILFILGEFDKAIPLESGLQQCYLPLQSHVHILKKSAHMGMWEETAKANEILFNFLKTTC